MKKPWHANFRRLPAAERTDALGHIFDSKAELRRWEELRLLERAGQISGLLRQQRFALVVNGSPVKIRSKGFPNGKPCYYTVDFVYTDTATGAVTYEDVKGVDHAESRLRRAVTEALFGIEIIVTGAAAKNTPRIARHG